jgi:hypothetical protein
MMDSSKTQVCRISNSGNVELVLNMRYSFVSLKRLIEIFIGFGAFIYLSTLKHSENWQKIIGI